MFEICCDFIFQSMTPDEKYLFCKDGKIVSVECQSTDNQPYYSTGEIVICNIDQGLVCENADNFPACQHDYMIRYQCEETTCKGNLAGIEKYQKHKKYVVTILKLY